MNPTITYSKKTCQEITDLALPDSLKSCLIWYLLKISPSLHYLIASAVIFVLCVMVVELKALHSSCDSSEIFMSSVQMFDEFDFGAADRCAAV